MKNPFSQQMQNLSGQIRAQVAHGLNAAANDIVEDIKGHVPVRTGALRDSYTVTHRATPQDLTIAVDSPLSYKDAHYPPAPPLTPIIGDPLFAPQSDLSRVQRLVSDRVAQSIREGNRA